tara:strand:- start:985 stop:1122 length:138 start_codon:yes stop_codon:yes gene_type:complete
MRRRRSQNGSEAFPIGWETKLFWMSVVMLELPQILISEQIVMPLA